MEKLQTERKNNPINRKPLASELKPNSTVQMMTKQKKIQTLKGTKPNHIYKSNYGNGVPAMFTS